MALSLAYVRLRVNTQNGEIKYSEAESEDRQRIRHQEFNMV